MRRLVLIIALVAGLTPLGPAPPAAVYACPMCKMANEANQQDESVNRRPRAYMYSILFMLSMPATLLAGFSFSFYRLWKKQELMAQMDAIDGDEVPESDPTA